MEDLSKQRQQAILIIGCGYIIPVLLVYWGFIPFSWRFYVMIITAIVMLAIARIYRYSPIELGLTKQNLENSFKSIALPTLVAVVLMLIYHAFQESRLDNSAYNWTFYLFFVIVSAPVQEFLYRGFLFGIFTRVKLAIWWQILLSTSLYSFVHIIYQDLPTLLLTFMVGLVWSCYYAKYRNLYSIIISHGLLGLVAILVGLV